VASFDFEGADCSWEQNSQFKLGESGAEVVGHDNDDGEELSLNGISLYQILQY